VIKYRLVVNGLGKVYDGASEDEAKRKFQLFVKQSKKRRSKSAPRLVTLFKTTRSSGNIRFLNLN
jgi:hypothetical protein